MGGGRYLNEFAVDLDVAGIGQLEAGEDLHERGFAGAIFSHHRVDAASFYHEFCAVVGVDARGQVALRDSTHPDCRHGQHSTAKAPGK